MLITCKVCKVRKVRKVCKKRYPLLIFYVLVCCADCVWCFTCLSVAAILFWPAGAAVIHLQHKSLQPRRVGRLWLVGLYDHLPITWRAPRDLIVDTSSFDFGNFDYLICHSVICKTSLLVYITTPFSASTSQWEYFSTIQVAVVM